MDKDRKIRATLKTSQIQNSSSCDILIYYSRQFIFPENISMTLW